MTRKTPATAPIETGDALRDARLALGLTPLQLGRALGLEGADKNVQLRISNYERGHGGRAVPRHVGLLVECFLQGARPSSWPD